MPLIVLSHDPEKPQFDLPEDLDKPSNDAWQQMQRELAHLSTASSHVIAKNSGHYIQIDRPELVIEAVHHVVDQVRDARAAQMSKP
jgi:pimeloyl-ACP methyl ester carboxylesterase